MAVSGFVGESVVAEKPDQSSAEEQIFIYTHKSFDINYNGDRVRALPRLCSTSRSACTPLHLGTTVLCPNTTAQHYDTTALSFRSCCLRFHPRSSMTQIIQVNLTSETPRPVTAGSLLEFTYSVKWEPTDIPFRKRFNRYLDYNFFEHQVWAAQG